MSGSEGELKKRIQVSYYRVKTLEEAEKLERQILDENMRYPQERNVDDETVFSTRDGDWWITRYMSPVGQELYITIHKIDADDFTVDLLLDTWADPNNLCRKSYEDVNK